jgi:hypothetical protein
VITQLQLVNIIIIPGKGKNFCRRVNFKTNIKQSMEGRSASKYTEMYLITNSSRFFKFKGIVKVECTDASLHAMKDCGGVKVYSCSRSYPWHRWGWVVSFTPWSVDPSGKVPPTPSVGGDAVDSTASLDALEKSPLFQPEI